MNGWMHFVRKETFHILRDARTMLVALLMPVVLLLLFGFAISTEVNNVDFAVTAPHPTEAIRRQVERVAANPYFTFCGYIAPTDIDAWLRRGEVDVVAVFADDYDRQVAAGRRATASAVRLITDASNPNNAAAGSNYLQSILLADDAAGTPELHILYNPQMKSAYNFVPGIMGLIFILICALMTSVSIVREKETGTLEVLLVSPAPPVRIVLAKMVPYFVLSCINLTTILSVAYFVLDVPMTGGLVAIVGMTLLYIVLSLALGLFISTLADRQITALLLSTMVMLLPVIMLSGMVFPIENMPAILQTLSCIIPARWYIDAMRKLMIEGLPFAYVWQDFLILAGMTVALIGLALKKFNDRLE